MPIILCPINKGRSLHPNKIAISTFREQITYEALDHDVQKKHAALKYLGVKAGDKVLIISHEEIIIIPGMLMLNRFASFTNKPVMTHKIKSF